MKKLLLLPLSLFIALSVISGCSSKEPAPEPKGPELLENPPTWGEGTESKQEVLDVERLTPKAPTVLGAVYYSATPPQGSHVEDPAFAQGRIRFTIFDRYDKKIPVTQANGKYYIQSDKGQRYTVRFENVSNIGYEVLLTTDGVDSITGHDGHFANTGYILFPGNYVHVKGFRQTREEYKPFRFDEKDSPYLPGSNEGSAANVGVIGFAIFQLKTPILLKGAEPDAFPAQMLKYR